MGFGDRLRREREMRGITLEEIANATKIGTRALRAVEEEEFDILPGGIFNKGFVRAYARYLGIDEEQAVADYVAAAGESEQKDLLDPENVKILEANWRSPKHDRISDERPLLPWTTLAISLPLLAIAFSTWYLHDTLISRYRQWRAHRAPQTQVSPVAEQVPATSPTISATPTVAATPVVPEKSSSVPKNDGPPAKSPSASSAPVAKAPAFEVTSKVSASNSGPTKKAPVQEFVVQVQAREDSWLSITADGKPVMMGMLTASQKKSIHAKQKITMVAGNAGGIEVSFNGHPQPTLGSSREVRTVIFTPEGMQR